MIYIHLNESCVMSEPLQEPNINGNYISEDRV